MTRMAGAYFDWVFSNYLVGMVTWVFLMLVLLACVMAYVTYEEGISAAFDGLFDEPGAAWLMLTVVGGIGWFLVILLLIVAAVFAVLFEGAYGLLKLVNRKSDKKKSEA